MHEDVTWLLAEGGSDELRILTVDAAGTPTLRSSVRGTFTARSVTSAPDGLLVAGTSYGAISVDDGARVLVAMANVFTPGHAVVVRLEASGAAGGWIVDGDAGSALALVEGAATSYAAGRFGGYGALVARFGTDAESPNRQLRRRPGLRRLRRAA